MKEILLKTYAELNKQEYSELYTKMNFITPQQTIKAEIEREQLLQFILPRVTSAYNESKIDVTNLSPGCKLCAEGKWSCLFINGVCNAQCFYCPTSQKNNDPPMTNTLTFQRIDDYIEYIKIFDFKGVSISGGEPFLSFDLSLNFIKRLRKVFDNKLYIWLYTNGILATPEKLEQLKNAGLNEIRFDLSATKYSLEKIKMATQIIDTVTVEIPTIPEDFELLKIIIPKIKEIGVKYLNLHQLRLTPFNITKLINHNYTFLHGTKVTVLESELTTLKLMKFNIENNINFPINYCSFVYKYRFQNLAARKRLVNNLCRKHEDITATGYIRNFQIDDNADLIEKLINNFEDKNINPENWSHDKKNNILVFNYLTLNAIEFDDFSVSVNYYTTSIHNKLSFLNMFEEIKLNRKRSIYVERKQVMQHDILVYDFKQLMQNIYLECHNSALPIKKTSTAWTIVDYERLNRGFIDYI